MNPASQSPHEAHSPEVMTRTEPDFTEEEAQEEYITEQEEESEPENLQDALKKEEEFDEGLGRAEGRRLNRRRHKGELEAEKKKAREERRKIEKFVEKVRKGKEVQPPSFGLEPSTHTRLKVTSTLPPRESSDPDEEAVVHSQARKIESSGPSQYSAPLSASGLFGAPSGSASREPPQVGGLFSGLSGSARGIWSEPDTTRIVRAVQIALCKQVQTEGDNFPRVILQIVTSMINTRLTAGIEQLRSEMEEKMKKIAAETMEAVVAQVMHDVKRDFASKLEAAETVKSLEHRIQIATDVFTKSAPDLVSSVEEIKRTTEALHLISKEASPMTDQQRDDYIDQLNNVHKKLEDQRKIIESYQASYPQHTPRTAGESSSSAYSTVAPGRVVTDMGDRVVISARKKWFR